MINLKVFLFQFLMWCVLVEAKIVGSLLKRKSDGKRRVAVLEPCPSSVDSNGDEALVEGTCRFLNERANTEVELLSFYDHYHGRLPASTKYGGSLYRRSDNYLRKAIRFFSWPLLLGRYDEFYVIGADLIDGYYDPSVSKFLFVMLRIGSHMGVKGNLISCSFNASPPESVQRSAREMLRDTRVNARDVYSAERLSRALGRSISYSADVAFGLLPEPTDNGRKIIAWIHSQEASGRRVLALNVNLLPITRQFAGREDEYIRHWGRWLGEMTARGFSFVMLPHDYRETWSDEAALRKILDQALPETLPFCLMPDERLHASEIKHVVSHCQLVVTGRMHLAIASMGAGVPVIAYAYQSKFEGILRLFGIARCVRPIEGMFDGVEKEVAFALETISHVDGLRTSVRAHIDEVLMLARRNIAKEEPE